MRPDDLIHKKIKAGKEIVDIDMRTLVKEGEVIFCETIVIDETRSGQPDSGPWYRLQLSRVGNNEPVELHLEEEYLAYFTIVPDR